MHTPVDVQVWRLSVLFLVGAASEILFQSYRAFRAVFRPKRFGYHLLDALIALILLSGLGAVLFIVNWGELRGYVPLTIMLGALITHGLIGNALYRKAYRVFAGTKRGLDWSHKNVIIPAKRAAGRSLSKIKTALFPPPPPPDEGDSPGPDGNIPPADDGFAGETPPEPRK